MHGAGTSAWATPILAGLARDGAQLGTYLPRRAVLRHMRPRQASSWCIPEAESHTDKALELVHDDLYGSNKLATLGGRRYFLLLIADATCYMLVVFQAAKSDAASVTSRWRWRSAAASSGCLGSIMMGSSRRPSSPPTVPMRGSLDTSPHSTPRSRTGWWSDEIRRWWRGRSSSRGMPTEF
jgi:hypothetical protein